MAYSLIRNNQFNILVSDTLSFNLGYGNETLFSVLTQNAPPSVVEEAGASMQQQALRSSSSGSASGGGGPIVAPYQLINHLPNATALTNRAGLIRSLNRQYSGTSSHVFDTMPTTYFLTAGVRSEAESPTLQQFYRRFNALQHGNLEASGVRMPAKHCERNMWMIKPAACSSGSQAVVVNNAADISTYVSHSKGDIVIQKYVERPLLVPLNRSNHGIDSFSSFAASGAGAVPSASPAAGHKVSVRLFVLVTDSGDVHVYKAPMVYAAPLPYASTPISQCGSVDEMLGIHVTSPDIHQTGAVSTSSLLNGTVDASAQPSPSQLTMSWAQLQHAIDATHPAGTFPPQVSGRRSADQVFLRVFVLVASCVFRQQSFVSRSTAPYRCQLLRCTTHQCALALSAFTHTPHSALCHSFQSIAHAAGPVDHYPASAEADGDGLCERCICSPHGRRSRHHYQQQRRQCPCCRKQQQQQRPPPRWIPRPPLL